MCIRDRDVTLDFVLGKEYRQPNSVLDNAIVKELADCDEATKEQILKIIKAIK